MAVLLCLTNKKHIFRFLTAFCALLVILFSTYYVSWPEWILSHNTSKTTFHQFQAEAMPIAQYSQTKTAPQKDALYVSISPNGRLGNRMFQLAALIGIAAKNNNSHIPVFPPETVLASAFKITHARVFNSLGFQPMLESAFAMYDRKMETLPRKNITLRGYFQSWKYFHHIREKIRQEFQFTDDVKETAASRINKLITGRENAMKIGVHIRRGDMLNTGVYNSGFRVPSLSYLHKASDYFRQKYDDVIFIVVSDDTKWCEANVKLPDFVMSKRASPFVDMAILASCTHVITTAGTFSWWGGYLAGGEVIYYTKRVAANSSVDRGFSPADHYLQEWVGIGD